MLLINKQEEKNRIILNLEGRIDTLTSNVLEKKLLDIIEQDEKEQELVLNLKKIDFISSAGLRVFLSAQKLGKTKEKQLILENINNNVMEVLKLTGFCNIFCIREKGV